MMGEGEAGGRAPEGKVGGGSHQVDRHMLLVVRHGVISSLLVDGGGVE